jgi:acyl-CoA dehydrogenase
MIDFGLNEDQRMVVDMAKDFAAKEILPKAKELRREPHLPSDIIDKAQELGWLIMDLSAEYGGGNMGMVESVLIAEVLGHACAGIALALLTNNLATSPIDYFGTPEQKTNGSLWCARTPPRLLLPDRTPDRFRSGDLKTHYEKKGSGYVINGQKAWISNANQAQLYVVFAYPKGSQQISELSAFIVPAESPGVVKMKPEKKLGLKASDTAGVVFEDVEVPADRLLAREGDGYRIAMKSLFPRAHGDGGPWPRASSSAASNELHPILARALLGREAHRRPPRHPPVHRRHADGR